MKKNNNSTKSILSVHDTSEWSKHHSDDGRTMFVFNKGYLNRFRKFTDMEGIILADFPEATDWELRVVPLVRRQTSYPDIAFMALSYAVPESASIPDSYKPLGDTSLFDEPNIKFTGSGK
jgi:hypothetical protein